jgi:uncharacterized membrane protein
VTVGINRDLHMETGERSKPKIAKSRLESFSDIVFGLALAISTIPLITRLPSRPFGILIDVAEFGFSFLILVSVWSAYTKIMSVLPVEDSFTINLNYVLLFLVSIEPYLFYLNISFDLLLHEVFLNLASILYALDMTGLMLLLALFTHELAKEELELLPKESVTSLKHVRNILFVSAALFAVTILPVFWTIRFLNQPIRFYFWFIPLLLSRARRVTQRQPRS